MLVFGEFNVFTRADTQHLLARMHASLKSNGIILIEPQTFEAIAADGKRPASWHTESSGLFSDKPHLWLEEHFWHAEFKAATTRYFIVDVTTGHVDRIASTSQAYSDEDITQLLVEAGFSSHKRYPSLSGSEDDRQEELSVIMAKKT